MFEKLLSALPFNPSTVQQLSFYGRRMRAEQSVRRIGLVFIVLAFLVQFFAFASPPQATLADSPNDLINGGFSSAAEAAADCNANLENYKTILANYGITCAKVASASTITMNSDDWGKQLWSMGYQPAAIAGETTVSVPGLGVPIYARYLWGWDKAGTSSNYQMLNVTSTGGQPFFLMYACGNLVSVGFPQPVQQPPALSISKTTVPGSPAANSTVTPGTSLGYRLYFSNTGGPATNIVLTDPQPTNTTETSFLPANATSSNFSNGLATFNFASMPAGASNWYVDIYFQVNAGVANGTSICNTASIRSGQTPTQTSNPVCVTVQVNAPPPTITPPQPAQPTVVPTVPQTPQSSCQQQLSSENTSACVTVSKTASNLTENISNANGTTAKAGDVIQYTLSATNTGSNTVSGYVFEDSLAYVLDYSNLTNANGGTLDSSNEISWPGVDIGAGQTVTKQFEVTVDNPIPQTPASTSDPNYFNLTMTNTFGNTITIKLPSTPVQAIQTTSAALPNTGPGNSIIVGAVVLAIAGFFFYRSRLLSKEARIAVTEQAGGE